MSDDVKLAETAKEKAARELTEARETHAQAYLAAQAAPGDPEEAALLGAATRDGRRAFRGYVRAATEGLAAQIDGPGPSNSRRGA